MNKKFRNILAYGCLAFSMMAMPSCVGDLDMKPNDPNSKTELNSAAEYEGFFYQLYNGLVVSSGLRRWISFRGIITLHTTHHGAWLR